MSAVPRYKDIDISFRKHPITGDVAPLTDADAVRRAVKLLVMTNFHERRYQPWLGSNVYFHLFENFNALTFVSLRRAIREVIENFEPRARVLAINFDQSSIDSNALECSITFSIENISEPIQITFNLERVR